MHENNSKIYNLIFFYLNIHPFIYLSIYLSDVYIQLFCLSVGLLVCNVIFSTSRGYLLWIVHKSFLVPARERGLKAGDSLIFFLWGKISGGRWNVYSGKRWIKLKNFDNWQATQYYYRTLWFLILCWMHILFFISWGGFFLKISDYTYYLEV